MKSLLKSPSKFGFFKRNPVLSTVAAVSMAFSANSYAAIVTWNGSGADANWSDGANWTGGVLSGGTDSVTMAGTTQLTNTVDSPVTLSSLTFLAGSGAFTLNGSDISLYGTNQDTPTLINNSTSNQIINNNITLLHSSSIGIGTSSAMGNFTINGNINAGTYTLGLNNSQTSLSSGNHYLTINGVISGSGIGGVVIEEQLGSAHIGHTVLNGVNTYTGPTTIFDTIVLVGTDSLSGQNGAFGNSTSSISLGATTGAFSPTILTNGAYTIGRNIQIRSGANTVTLGGTTANISNYSGNITMGDASGAAVGLTTTAASGGRVNFSGNLTRATGATGAVDNLIKAGGGVVALSGSSNYQGTTTVNAGALLVNGTLDNTGAGVTVASGAIFGGNGTINRSVTVAAGGILAPGDMSGSSTTSTVGTLTLGTGLTSGLTLNNTSVLKFDLQQGNFTIGTGINDLITVDGALTLDGTLQVNELGGSLTPGTYRLFNYTGALTDNTLNIDSSFLAAHPGSTIDTSVANQINLVAVPEPSSVVFLALGLLYFAGARRFASKSC